jgi:excisionase family DNA binding protein
LLNASDEDKSSPAPTGCAELVIIWIPIVIQSANQKKGRICKVKRPQVFMYTVHVFNHVQDCATVISLSQPNIPLAQLAQGRMALDTLLSVEEAARRLGGLSKYTIHAWLSSGKLRRTKVGSRTMIRESELARVIEDGGKSQTARSRKQ